MDSCPKELEPYDRAHKLKEKRIDEYMWIMGLYIKSSIASVMDKRYTYEKEPFLRSREIDTSEEGLRKQRELFVAKLEAMGANFELRKRELKNGD